MASTTPGFSLNDFESLWDGLDEKSKVQLVEKAGLLSPTIGIGPIIEGITSFHFSVRSQARKSLEDRKSVV